ncbi:ABC-2 type transport system permease protein [Natranaerovirga pectinivora]|uniref:ABC-2 type transport system permease protein n=1 Tax=Natranaerovirga pectinivora TaxID=682400 RepID=A0A4R3MNN2_9FIRM|nr:ABC transporter permease [Natranaerovirga pectinivora]TCT16130.1 ABC-2 type transport system permease protein [Natranaerovirga pectinivora]
MTVFKFALLRAYRSKRTVLSVSLLPIGLILIRPLWVGENPAGFGFGFLSLVIMSTAFLLVQGVMTDRVSGTIRRIYAAPIKEYNYLVENLLAYQLILTAQIAIVILIGSFLYQWNTILSVQYFLCYTIFGSASIGLTLAWNSLFKNKESSDAVFSIIVTMMALLGGIFVPIEALPDVLAKIGMVFPTYWVSIGLLAITNNEVKIFMVSIVALLMFTCAFIIFGSKRRLE